MTGQVKQKQKIKNMKVELKEKSTKPFQPITITVTVESMNELVELYARVNISTKSIGNYVPCGSEYNPQQSDIMPLFRIVEQAYKNQTT